MRENNCEEKLPTPFQVCEGLDFPELPTEATSLSSIEYKHILPSPKVVLFEYRYLSKKISQVVHIHNITPQAVSVSVKPPASKFFTISRSKKCQGPILPGIPLPIKVTFNPDAIRIYHDCIRVSCLRHETVKIPLQAIPYETCQRFLTEHINFGTIPLGSSALCKRWLQPMKLEDLVFEILPSWQDKCLTVTPLKGVLRANDPSVEFRIVYTPKAFITIAHEIHLLVPKISKSPYVMTVMAECKPGLIRDYIMDNLRRTKWAYSPMETTTVNQKSAPAQSAWPCTTYYDKIMRLQVPTNTLHALATLVNRPLGINERPYELLGPFGRYYSHEIDTYRQRKKEFNEKVIKFRNRNAPKYTPDDQETIGAGSEKMGLKVAFALLDHEKEEWAKFEGWQNLYEHELVLVQTVPDYRRRKLISEPSDWWDEDEWFALWEDRKPKKKPPPHVQWFVRSRVLYRFIGAVRKVIVFHRLKKNLKLLKAYKRMIESETSNQSPDINSIGQDAQVK